MIVGPLISAEEFMEIQTPDTVRLELDEGILVVSPHNVFEHQYAAQQLLLILYEWAKRNAAGIVVQAMDMRLADRTVRAADFVFISNQQRDILKRRRIVGGPHLVVEVLSESTAALDRGRKMQQYAEAGVAHYWLIDPLQRTLELYENRAGTLTLIAECSGDDERFHPAASATCAFLWPRSGSASCRPRSSGGKVRGRPRPV